MDLGDIFIVFCVFIFFTILIGVFIELITQNTKYDKECLETKATVYCNYQQQEFGFIDVIDESFSCNQYRMLKPNYYSFTKNELKECEK